MKAKPLVYVAGPYSSPDPVQNTHDAVRCATWLLKDGRVTPFVPHLTLFWHAITPLPYELWCAYDLEILARCDALLRRPGRSHGADDEVVAARRFGLPVFEDVQALLSWADWNLLAHCAAALGMDAGEVKPAERKAMAERILERLGLDATATDDDLRTQIGVALLWHLPDAGAWPAPIKWSDVVATVLGLEQPQGTHLIDTLFEVANGTQSREGGEDTS
jgi:hypothetical protein